MVTEFTVCGRLGPVLQAAFADERISLRQASTVIRTEPTSTWDLTDLIRTLVERGVVVRSVHRLTDVRPSAVAPNPSLAEGDASQPCARRAGP
jgi:hypothetical protein